jgi:hypothetical protein
MHHVLNLKSLMCRSCVKSQIIMCRLNGLQAGPFTYFCEENIRSRCHSTGAHSNTLTKFLGSTDPPNMVSHTRVFCQATRSTCKCLHTSWDRRVCSRKGTQTPAGGRIGHCRSLTPFKNYRGPRFLSRTTLLMIEFA